MKIHGLKYLILFFFIAFYCNAQNPVLPLFSNRFNEISGTYYKDLDNDLDNFVGTWVSNSGNTILTFKFIKVEMLAIETSVQIYEDVLIGGYSYTVNNQILVNTIPQLDNNQTNFYDYYLYCATLLNKNSIPRCIECFVDEKRALIIFNDPYRQNIPGLSATLVLRRITENGVAKLQAKLIQESNAFQEEGQPAPPNDFTVPFGEYVLTKVD